MNIKSILAKKITKKAALKFGIFGTATGLGAASWYASSPPGLKKEGAMYGATIGATTGLGIIYSPQIAKTFVVGTKTRLRTTKVGRAYRTGRVVFRKIRGRIIPIKAK
jgi:hypothetical protein